MLTVGNVYGHGFGTAEVSRLERLGFAIRPQVDHYAGSQILRFIDFERGPPLELIEVASKEEYENFVPRGMVPYSPGISLVLPSGSRKTLADFRDEFGGLRPHPLHVNYDDTSDPGKPGWNYLNFEVSVIPGIFLWLTQLEEPRPQPERAMKHANGARGLRGLLLDLEAEKLATLARLVGGEVVRGAMRIGGLTFWTWEAFEDPPRIPGKRFPLVAAVVETDRSDVRMAEREGALQVSFLSSPATRVPTGPLSWDLLMTTSGAGRDAMKT